MHGNLEIDDVRRQLEGRFGLRLISTVETFDGGDFPVIRPADLDYGVGFCIALSRTHRQVEASFRADNFAAGLMRRMSEADSQLRKTFELLRTQSFERGAQIDIAIDGNEIAALPLSPATWKMLELSVSRRLPVGRAAPSALADATLSSASICLTLILTLIPVEEALSTNEKESSGLPEGARIRVEVNRYERSPANRAACISHYGSTCQACSFDFEVVYGPRGAGYIEVHHRVMVSEMGPDYFVDPIRDLVPLCANCHAIVHRTNPPIEVDEVRELLKSREFVR